MLKIYCKILPVFIIFFLMKMMGIIEMSWLITLVIIWAGSNFSFSLAAIIYYQIHKHDPEA